MHLQLTLIEQLISIAIATDKKYFSPWKSEYRTPQGVIHALYVFRVIEDFFYNFSYNSNLDINLLNHAQTRRQEIESQISEIESFIFCPDLTEIGKNFTKQLIYKQRANCHERF